MISQDYEESDQISMVYEILNTLIFRFFLNFIGISFGQDRKMLLTYSTNVITFSDIENVIKSVGGPSRNSKMDPRDTLRG